ncbi:GENERAL TRANSCRIPTION FACTOR IIH SUBUNIT 5 [Salix koriyanagi]|uniref:General transcription and DNA repair factor IIH subunit TFB5 n=1 Tax=Salix koriyanagi TaxID=2511006 RepID=A0A9Q0Q7M9_9ROSI|nr:GENERAL TRANSCRIPTION FACTOR IIH SUBUNIT 5 [Salix koriyanagi]
MLLFFALWYYSQSRKGASFQIPETFLAVQTSDANKMVNATKGLLISCDIPMAQFIINLNASLPASQKFIIHILDNTHMFVQSHASDMIRSAISDFREQNSYEKPS